MTEATKRPWVAEPEYEDGPANFIHKEGFAIADCNMGNGAEDDANAALIVEAVNAYDSMQKVRRIVDVYFEPWGAAKAARWEFLSGDSGFDPETALRLIQTTLSPRDEPK